MEPEDCTNCGNPGCDGVFCAMWRDDQEYYPTTYLTDDGEIPEDLNEMTG